MLDSFLSLSVTDKSQVKNYFSRNPSGMLSPILERTMESQIPTSDSDRSFNATVNTTKTIKMNASVKSTNQEDRKLTGTGKYDIDKKLSQPGVR